MTSGTAAELFFEPQHEASVARFTDTGVLGRGIGGALDYGLAGLGSALVITSITFGEARWVPGSRWTRRVTIGLSSAGKQIAPARVDVPWLVSDEAREHPRVAGHRGTFYGRARIPITVFTRAPGIRFVAWQLRNRVRLVAEIVPNHGVPFRLELAGRATARYVQLRGRGVFERAAERRFGLDLAGIGDTELSLDEFMAQRRYRGRFEPASLSERIVDLSGSPRASDDDWLTAADLRVVVDVLVQKHAALSDEPLADGEEPMLPMDRRNWAPQGYGDLLTIAAGVAARRAAGSISLAMERGLVAGQVATGLLAESLERELVALAKGDGAYATSTSVERLTNTLATVELARQHSFLGPFGLEGYSGRIDLRVLPSGWRESLCPVQTPESKKVGLVRFAALGGLAQNPIADYSDLSAAAALVPFIGHDDPTRASIGAKMLRQAVVLDNAEPPLVRTGAESVLATWAGVATAPNDGIVTALDATGATIDDTRVVFGPPPTEGSGQHTDWNPRIAIDDYVKSGAIVAVARDVVLEGQTPVLRLGLTASVAFLPWNGWNYEDGIVVSASFAARMSSTHIICVSALLEASTDQVWELLAADRLGTVIAAGTPILRIIDSADTVRDLSFPENARIVAHSDPELPFDRYVIRGTDEVSVRFEVARPLEIGDKLTTRHSGKGVVTRIEPDDAMPRWPDGTPVEVLLNPLGVLRRLNAGTVFELNAGLAAQLSGAGAVTVPRRLGSTGRAELATQLMSLGAPGGRVMLTVANGTPVGPAEGVLAGPLYLLKLDHLARAKASGRPDAGPSPLSFQPARTSGWGLHRKVGAPQRMGEMEVWALEAIGADLVLDDLLRRRGVGSRPMRDRSDVVSPALRSAIGHLAVAGMHVDALPSGLDLTTSSECDVRAISRVRLRWSPLHDGLRDIHEFRDQAIADVTLPRGANLTKVARRMLRLALAEVAGVPDLGLDGARESVAFHIPLVRSIDHPWRTRKGALPELNSIAVMPLDSFGAEDRWDDEAMFRRYIAVIEANLVLAEQPESEVLRADLERRIRVLLGRPGDKPDSGSVAGRLGGKFGVLRRNLLGAAAVRSGRAVLVGDPTMDVERVTLPKWLMSDLGLPVDRNPAGFEDVVFVNRQPTLHPYSIVALRAIESPDNVIRIHPYLLQALAGDFDGDTAAVHRPSDEKSREQVWNLRRPAATLRSAAAGALISKLDLDVSVGLLLGTKGQEGRAELSRLTGVAVDAPVVGAASVAALAEQVIRSTGESTARERRLALDHLVRVMGFGLRHASRWGFTLADVPSILDGGVRAGLDAAPEDTPLGRIAEAFDAGAAGKEVDLEQLLVARGVAVTPNHLMPASAVSGNYVDGIGTPDYFAAAQTSVAALAAKKLVTPVAGSLTKYLVELGYELTVQADDCGYRGADHGPLTCVTAGGPCQKGYGADLSTGNPIALGQRVGILAAMLIGEKSTQLAMRSIHQRSGSSGLSGTVSEVAGIFGAGSFDLETGRTNILDEVAAQGNSAGGLLAALERFDTLFGKQVSKVHAAVLLRPCLDAAQTLIARSDPGEKLKLKDMRELMSSGRSVLGRASERGSLAAIILRGGLIDGEPVGGGPADNLRTRLILGAVRYD